MVAARPRPSDGAPPAVGGDLAAAPMLGGFATQARAQAAASSRTPSRPRRWTATAGLAGGLQRRARRPEHEPQVRDDGAVPAGDDQHHPRRLRPRRHLLRCGRGLRPARGASASSAKAIAPFRDKVVITSKFGWNIDLETGERRPGLNSKPDHIKLAVEGMLKRLRTDRIDLLYQHRVDPEVPIEDVAGAVKDLMDAGQGSALGPVRDGARTRCAARMPRCPSPPCRTSTRCCGAGPRRKSSRSARSSASASCRGARSACSSSPAAIDANTRFAPGDIRGVESRFSPENLPHNLALVELVKTLGRAEAGHARPDRAGLADGAEAVDRAHPGDDADGAHAREQRRGRRAIHAGRARRAECGRPAIEIRGARLPDAGAGLLGRGGAAEEVRRPCEERSDRETHAETQTRKQRPGSLGPRARLHGPELRLRPGRGQAGRRSR